MEALAGACEAGVDVPGILAAAATAATAAVDGRDASGYLLSGDGRTLHRQSGDGPLDRAAGGALTPSLEGDDLVVPLVAGRRLLGALAVHGPRADGAAERARARVAAAVAAGAVESSRLWESGGGAAGARDVQTGLPNHRGFHDRLAEELARGMRTGQPVAVAVLDIDGFGAYNGARGHAEGDRALHAAAASLLGAVRAYDTVARLGSDEFALILPSTGPDAAAALVRRVAAGFAERHGLTLSGGVAAAPRHGHTAADVVRAAGAALRSAAVAGGRVLVGDAAPADAAEAAGEDAARSLRSIEAARGHSAAARAVSDVVGAIGAQMRLAPERVERMRMAAYLYEASAPAAAAGERSRLAAGAGALAPEEARWLGAPAGGDAPLEARAIAVAEAFVRLDGHRGEAAAGRALAELWSAGRAYDPRCVRALERVLAARSA
jgi:diguanylate cyclase (GGDEF)-like protein